MLQVAKKDTMIVTGVALKTSKCSCGNEIQAEIAANYCFNVKYRSKNYNDFGKLG